MSSQDEPSQDEPEGLTRAKAYLEEMHGKLERKEPLTLREKRFLLRTYNLPYKALTFPESLTPAERNRILLMPPPDEVTANIRRVTNGTMSTTEEVFQRAIEDAETMTDEELALIIDGFATPESIYEQTRRFRWLGKFGRIGHLAFNAMKTDLEKTAHRRAAIRESPERTALRREREVASVGSIETSEQRRAYFQNEARLRAAAEEKGRLWDEQDKVLFTEVKASMMKMADELDGEECHCESCSGQQNSGQQS
jgi:hypothetical protein